MEYLKLYLVIGLQHSHLLSRKKPPSRNVLHWQLLASTVLPSTATFRGQLSHGCSQQMTENSGCFQSQNIPAHCGISVTDSLDCGAPPIKSTETFSLQQSEAPPPRSLSSWYSFRGTALEFCNKGFPYLLLLHLICSTSWEIYNSFMLPTSQSIRTDRKPGFKHESMWSKYVTGVP